MIRVLVLAFALLVSLPAWADNPGGFIQTQGSSSFVSRYSAGTINGFVPATRSCFNFPSPYSSRGCRLTIPADGTVEYVGYAFWANMNYHVNDPDILIMLSLNAAGGTEGPTLFRFNKSTEVITKVGPIFPNGDNDRSNFANNGMYFSASQSTKLFWIDYATQSRVLRMIDVLTQVQTDVWDIRTTGVGSAGSCTVSACTFAIMQPHSNTADTAFSAVLCTDYNNCAATVVGCLVKVGTVVRFYANAATGILDECAIDKSGVYLITFEKASVGAGSYNLQRYFNVSTGGLIGSQGIGQGMLAHYDTGYGYVVGQDPAGALPQQSIRWDVTAASAVKGPVVHYNNNGAGATINLMGHISHLNARSGYPLNKQWVCGGNDTSYYATAYDINNDITCVRPDGTTDQLIVAPTMTDPTTAPCNSDAYACQPKGNLDVTGNYFIWTTNLSGTRLDAFIVKVPYQLLVPADPVPTPPPPVPPIGTSCQGYHALQDGAGNLMPANALLTVKQAGTQTKATIYSDATCTTVTTNPVQKGASDWSFYATSGIYDLTFSLRDFRFTPTYGVPLFGPGSTSFATLGTPQTGLQLYCVDCTYNSNPCTGGSQGAFAKGVNGVWRCD